MTDLSLSLETLGSKELKLYLKVEQNSIASMWKDGRDRYRQSPSTQEIRPTEIIQDNKKRKLSMSEMIK
jgi:hypothetical protein